LSNSFFFFRAIIAPRLSFALVFAKASALMASRFCVHTTKLADDHRPTTGRRGAFTTTYPRHLGLALCHHANVLSHLLHARGGLLFCRLRGGQHAVSDTALPRERQGGVKRRHPRTGAGAGAFPKSGMLVFRLEKTPLARSVCYVAATAQRCLCRRGRLASWAAGVSSGSSGLLLSREETVSMAASTRTVEQNRGNLLMAG
jgi:hypothetical protein